MFQSSILRVTELLQEETPHGSASSAGSAPYPSRIPRGAERFRVLCVDRAQELLLYLRSLRVRAIVEIAPSSPELTGEVHRSLAEWFARRFEADQGEDSGRGVADASGPALLRRAESEAAASFRPPRLEELRRELERWRDFRASLLPPLGTGAQGLSLAPVFCASGDVLEGPAVHWLEEDEKPTPPGAWEVDRWVGRKEDQAEDLPPDARCGLCGKGGALTLTRCCREVICDDGYLDPWGTERRSCYRNHESLTVCGTHHELCRCGSWQDCEDHRLTVSLESWVWQATNEYNFVALDEPPALKPSVPCADCGRMMWEGSGLYSVHESWWGSPTERSYHCHECRAPF